jgi:hypothetical protein
VDARGRPFLATEKETDVSTFRDRESQAELTACEAAAECLRKGGTEEEARCEWQRWFEEEMRWLAKQPIVEEPSDDVLAPWDDPPGDL